MRSQLIVTVRRSQNKHSQPIVQLELIIFPNQLLIVATILTLQVELFVCIKVSIS